MNTYEIIKKLCKNRGIAVTALESSLGFSRGSIGKLRDGRSMNSDRLQKVADYFGVTVEYLMTGENPDYYVNPEAAEIAQRIFENRDLRLLFDAAQDTSAENIQLLTELLVRIKKQESKNTDT